MTRRTFFWILALTALAWLPACGLPTGDLIVYTADDPELAQASVSDEGVWESVPWSAPEAPWLDYPPRATLQLEHTLGHTPRFVLVYLSFDAIGSEPALAAGDLARIVSVDDTTVSVRNETSAAFFVRVVAE